jgi:hypothetical protein
LKVPHTRRSVSFTSQKITGALALYGINAVTFSLFGASFWSSKHNNTLRAVAPPPLTMQNAYDEMLRKIQLMGQTTYGEELRRDIAFWVECESESGRGYKQRIVARNEGWFGAEQRDVLETQLRDVLQREWNAGVGKRGGASRKRGCAEQRVIATRRAGCLTFLAADRPSQIRGGFAAPLWDSPAEDARP